MQTLSQALLVAVLLGPVLVTAEQPPVASSGDEGAVLLRNGQVLHGKVTRMGDHYIVSLASGEIRLKADAVERVCRDLEEGYLQKHADLEQGKVQDRLELAQWCIRHELFGYAAREIADAIATDPMHPRIALVERQLELARERRTPHSAGGATPDATPSNDDLDRLTRGMPPGTVEMFGNTIQPLLLNTCTAAGCHGPQSETGLRLLRIPLGKTPSRRLTQRNLHAVLATINHDDPPASPLLTAPIGPHGTAKAAIFTNREVVQYKHLVDWVHRVASDATAPQPPSVERPSQNLLQNMPAAAATLDDKKKGTGNRQGAAAGKERASPMPPAADAPAFDEFDPEIFNRQASPK